MILTTDNIDDWDKLDWWGWSDSEDLITDDDDTMDILDKLDWWGWTDTCSEDLVTDDDDTIDFLDWWGWTDGEDLVADGNDTMDILDILDWPGRQNGGSKVITSNTSYVCLIINLSSFFQWVNYLITWCDELFITITQYITVMNSTIWFTIIGI